MSSDCDQTYDSSPEDDCLYESPSESEFHVNTDDDTEEEFSPFRVLSTEQLLSTMADIISEVNGVIQLPSTITRSLLNHFSWDKERLYEVYYTAEREEDQEQLFREAHVVNPNSVAGKKKKSSEGSQQPLSRAMSVSVECLICYLDYPETSMISISCGHQFCTDCWSQYLTTKIMEEGQGPTISCANTNCDILVDDETVFKLITDTKVLQRYRQLITNSFVQSHRHFRWCPKSECGHVIKVEQCEFRSVTCVCSTVFCFLCGYDWHYPLKCDLLKKWLKKCSDDSETFNWIAANTKDCPKCQMPIEKNGGCNHMWCRNPTCKYEFCWLCMSDWSTHGYNPCNRYNEEDAVMARTAQERARAVLKRYLFYCNRYMNHLQSLKMESRLGDGVRSKMEAMQQHNMTWVEVQFLRTAVNVLVSCRETLMYTYAFAYYLVKNNQVHIFEDNQKDLEAAIEELSGYLERDFGSQDNLRATKQEVQDKFRYCEQRRKVLLQHVKEGYERAIWQCNEDLN